MAIRDTSSVGAPCWVDTWQPEPQAATEFYGQLFGWSFDEAIPMSGIDGEYYRARLNGHLVAGVGQAPPQSPAGWLTHVRVEDVSEASARAEQAGGRQLMSLDAHTPTALVADSSGVLFCLRQAGEHEGVELADQPNCWAMSSLHTPDLGKARDFYRTMFAWELKSSPDAAFSLWLLQDRMVAVATSTEGVDVPPNWSVNFAVDSADTTADRAVALGGGILMEPSNTPGFRSAVISDPWGGVVAVSAVAA
ncbi:VOC family protein [Arthrobacter sp. SLBN-112]|uniref:VOC family protein n=1 Tax=Arthrobacter sp. SLBN-112 TaxID=2768452 RepID=UPI0027AE6DAC|nr:VOC family protein [Arthrobacter sp. SLBN-112]MDQ0799733.1 putative enzyme related to lactoylglutathione lyase [Arthrobacter sp. SLBN-112]